MLQGAWSASVACWYGVPHMLCSGAVSAWQDQVHMLHRAACTCCQADCPPSQGLPEDQHRNQCVLVTGGCDGLLPPAQPSHRKFPSHMQYAHSPSLSGHRADQALHAHSRCLTACSPLRSFLFLSFLFLFFPPLDTSSPQHAGLHTCDGRHAPHSGVCHLISQHPALHTRSPQYAGARTCDGVDAGGVLDLPGAANMGVGAALGLLLALQLRLHPPEAVAEVVHLHRQLLHVCLRITGSAEAARLGT